MAIYRNVQMSFWTDSKVIDDFTPEDKYFYLYLFTNPHTNLCGCYEISLRQIANETGYNRDTIERLIERFEKFHKVIVYSKENKEILLLNWHKYNWTKSEKFLEGLDKSIREVKDKEFRRYLFELTSGADTVHIPYTNGMDTTVTFSFSDAFTDSDLVKDSDKDAESIRTLKKSKKVVYYPNDEKLNQTFVDFMNMRKKLRAPMTDRAITLAIKRLQELSTDEKTGIMDNDLAIKILEQSIMRSWKGLFPLKADGSGSSYVDKIANRLSEVDGW